MSNSKKIAKAVGLSLCLAFGNAKAHHSCANKPEFAHINAQLPVVFDALLFHESGRKQLDENNNPIRSEDDAIGIAQMLTPTAKETAQKNKITWDEQKFMYDANYNKNLGWLYFNELHVAFECDVRKTLAAYNWGRGNLSKALKQAKRDGTGSDGWYKVDTIKTEDGKYIVKKVPVETKDYINRIMFDVTKATAVSPTSPASPASPASKPAFSTAESNLN